MPRTRRRGGAWLNAMVVFVVGLSPACGESDSAPAPAPAPAAPPAVVRLWQDIPRVPTPKGVISADFPRTVLSPEQARAAGWYRVVASPGSEKLALLPFVPGDESLTLSRDRELAVALPLPTGATEALSIGVTLRVPDGVRSSELPRAVLVEIPEELGFRSGLSLEDFSGLCDAERTGSHQLASVAPGTPERLSTEFVVARIKPELVLFLIAPAHTSSADAAVAIESVEVRSARLVDYLAQGRRWRRLLRERDHEAVSITLDREQRRGLLALPGRRYVVTLPPDARPRRLDLALGVAPRNATLEGAIRLTVAADGQTLLDERLTAPKDASEPAWRDVTLALPAGASELVLSAEGEGPDPPVALFGHPTLRASPAAGDRRFNVVLVSLDTLRPDRLGCYGASPSPSPRIDALAREGLLFTQAYSTSSYTLPAHGSMFTGQYPAVHGAVDPTDRLDVARSPFLARMLADAGYVTAGFTGGAYLSSDFGFGEGFDRYAQNDPVWALDSLRGRQLVEMGTGANADQHAELLRRYATPMLTSWIERQDDGVSFFLFAHTYVVHNYAPDQARLKEHGLLGEGGQQARLDDAERERFNFGETALHDKLYAEFVPYYEATIEMADEFVGALLDALDRAGLAERTLVIVTSDHGEEFGEHGYFGHGKNLYESNVRVPLVVRLPAAAAAADGGAAAQPGAIDELVSLVDLPPFILRSVGLQPDPRMSLGASWDATRVAPPARSQVVIELDTRWERVSAVREGAMKVSVRTEPTKGKEDEAETEAPGTNLAGKSPAKVEVFDVVKDVEERTDLGGASAEAARLRAALEDFVLLTGAIRAKAGSSRASEPVLDPQAIEQLIQLGYIEGQPDEAPKPEEQKPEEPK